MLRSYADTIFALSTAPGRAGIAIIRISGTHAENVLRTLTHNHLPQPRKAAFTKLFNPSDSTLLDEALVLWFPAPKSFTGEDVAELHIHGSRAIIQSLFRILSTITGLRIAEAGEFAQRAFSNGKLDLTQAEGLADLIDAETENQRHQALRQMQGTFRQKCEIWRKSLLEILASIEAYIDFPDEDLPATLKEKTAECTNTLLQELAVHIADKKGERIRDGIHVAILGAPNTGKSTLLNILAQREVAIVSDIPGTTRDVLETHLDIGGYAVTFYDTAGLRATTDAIESEGVRRAHAHAGNADIRLCLFDAACLPSLDPATLAIVDDQTMVLLSRNDLKSEKIILPEHIAGHIPIIISSKTGIDHFIDALQTRIEAMMSASRESAIVTQERHRRALSQCAERLGAFLTAISRNKPTELCVEEARQASNALGTITGHIHTEELLGEIFSRFCIGK